MWYLLRDPKHPPIVGAERLKIFLICLRSSRTSQIFLENALPSRDLYQKLEKIRVSLPFFQHIDLPVFSKILSQSCNVLATLNYKVLESRQERDVLTHEPQNTKTERQCKALLSQS